MKLMCCINACQSTICTNVTLMHLCQFMIQKLKRVMVGAIWILFILQFKCLVVTLIITICKFKYVLSSESSPLLVDRIIRDIYNLHDNLCSTCSVASRVPTMKIRPQKLIYIICKVRYSPIQLPNESYSNKAQLHSYTL